MWHTIRAQEMVTTTTGAPKAPPVPCLPGPSLLSISSPHRGLAAGGPEELAKTAASLPPMHIPAQVRALGLPLRCRDPSQSMTLYCRGLLGQSLGNTQLPEN